MGSDRVDDDTQLWRRSATNPEAFGELFERHARAVYSYCYWRTGDASLAEDLTSVVFLEAWARRTSVTITGTSVRPWLLGIANNVARNALRSLRRYRSVLRRIPRGVIEASGQDDVVGRVDARNALSSARHVLDEQSGAEREVVILVFWCGLTYQETADALGIPIGTVRSRVSRTRKKLQLSLAPVAPCHEESI
jgi:RNA polymerase sigma factor (sigma-70 family)